MNNLVDSYPQAGSSLMESLASLLPSSSGKQKKYTAILRKIVRTSAFDNPWKVLWVVLSSLLFKEFWKKGTTGHGHMFASVKGKQQK